MAEAGTLCGNADVAKYAGANANTTANAEAYTNVYIKEAEGFICAQSRYDWVSDYTSVSTIGKEFLRNVTAAYAAIMVIEYDMSGYTSRTTPRNQPGFPGKLLRWARLTRTRLRGPGR